MMRICECMDGWMIDRLNEWAEGRKEQRKAEKKRKEDRNEVKTAEEEEGSKK